MTPVPSLDDGRRDSSGAHERPLIDCDVHPGCPGGWRSIFERLPVGWRTRFENQGLQNRPAFGSDADPAALAARTFAGAGPGSWALLVPPEAISAWAEPCACAALAAAINDYLAEEWLAADERFRLAVVAVPQAPHEAASEIRRQAASGTAAAVLLPLVDVLMGDEHYYPIYAAAAEADLPVVVHSTSADGRFVGAPGLSGGHTVRERVRVAAIPAIAQANISSLVFRGVFERFPTLRVAFTGFGAMWLPPLLWRMDMDWRRCRVEVPWTKTAPTEYVRRHVWCGVDDAEVRAVGTRWEPLLWLSPLDEVLVRGSHDGPRAPVGELDERLAANARRLLATAVPAGQAIEA